MNSKRKLIKFIKDLKDKDHRRLYYLIFRYLNIWKTLYLNFRVLPIKQAVKLPIWIYGRVSFVSLCGKIEIRDCDISTAMIHLGFPEDMYFNPKSSGVINIDGKLVFTGNLIGCCDYNFKVYKNAELTFGKDIKLGAKSNFVCRKEIHIGDFTRIGFDVLFMDSDFHFITELEEKVVKNTDSSIIIGSYNWIGTKSTVKKGVATPSNLIVASGSLLNKNYINTINEYSLIGGTPAKLLKVNVSRIWNGKSEFELHQIFDNNNLENFDVSDFPYK